MAFSAVFQFEPNDEAGKARWLLEHYVEHQSFVDALAGLAQPFLATSYPIQRMEDSERWLAAHQQMSQSVWTGLGGGQSTDFGRVEWDDPAALQDWFNYHALWHQNVREQLGL